MMWSFSCFILLNVNTGDGRKGDDDVSSVFAINNEEVSRQGVGNAVGALLNDFAA